MTNDSEYDMFPKEYVNPEIDLDDPRHDRELSWIMKYIQPQSNESIETLDEQIAMDAARILSGLQKYFINTYLETGDFDPKSTNSVVLERIKAIKYAAEVYAMVRFEYSPPVPEVFDSNDL